MMGSEVLLGKILMIIPARGGSKGFPGKNLALLGGIPLVGRVARTARQALAQLKVQGRVIISTDDPAIAAAAREWGAEIPFMRPAELASDTAASIDVVLHAIRGLQPESFDLVVLMQPTSPLTEVDDVVGAIELAHKTGDAVVSVCEAEHPAHWQYLLDDSGRMQPLLSSEKVTRRQDARKAHRLNGAVYVATPRQIAELQGFVGADTRGLVMPAERSVDVDCALDLDVARAMLQRNPPAPIRIGDRLVGPGQPCFVIAEAGVNHNGSVELAIKLVEAAHAAGADAVKFQTFKAERLATAAAPKAEYQTRTTGAGENQLDMLRRLELTPQAHELVLAACKRLGIRFLSSPFDEESATYLDELGVEACKIPSGEITNLPFLEHVARLGKPVILSTGMSTLREVASAVDAISQARPVPLALLHCVSNYPAAPADVNLRAMATMQQAFGVPVGYSDHTEGDEVTVAAVAMGACIIEKHFTLDRNLPGPDHQASLQPGELADLVRRVREVETSLGSGIKVPAPSEAGTAIVARKSLVAAMRLTAGSVLTREMLVASRPGNGMSPAKIQAVIGRTLVTDVEAGQPLRVEMFS